MSRPFSKDSPSGDIKSTSTSSRRKPRRVNSPSPSLRLLPLTRQAALRSLPPSYSSIGTPPVERALALLQSTSFLDEKKAQIFDADVVAAMRGLFPAGKAYSFDMFASTQVGTGASAFVNQALAISPAVVTYSEWASLASLFDEVRLMKAQVLFIPMVGSDGQNLSSATAAKTLMSAFICGANHDNISTSPASYAAVGRLAKSANVVRCIGDTSGQSSVFHLKALSGLGWARTVTPAVQDPPAGILGSFDLASDTTSSLSVTTVYYKNVLRTTVWLRNRA